MSENTMSFRLFHISMTNLDQIIMTEKGEHPVASESSPRILIDFESYL